MFNNYITTIPQVADTLRTLGYSQPKPVRVGRLPVDNLNPANADYRDQWRKEAMQNAYDSISATKSSQAMMLLEPYYPRKSNNRSQAPFQSSQSGGNENVDWNTKIYSGHNPTQGRYSGGGNVTYSSVLSDVDFETYRKKLLDARLKDFSVQPEFAPTPAPPIPQQNTFMQNKQMIDITLNSVADRINSGIADNSVYNDLLKVTQFYNNFIWQINSVPILNELLIDIGDIIETAEGAYKTYQDKALDPKSLKNLRSINPVIMLLDKFKDYVTANVSFVGRNENERKINAKVTSYLLSKYTRKEMNKIQDDNEEDEYVQNLNEGLPPAPAPEENDGVIDVEDEEELPPALAPPQAPMRGKREEFRLTFDPKIQQELTDTTFNKLSPELKKAYLFYQGKEVYDVDKGITLLRIKNDLDFEAYEKDRRKKNPTLYNPAEQVGSGKKSRKLRGGVQFRYNWDYYDKYK